MTERTPDMTHKQILDDLRQPVKDLREHTPGVFQGYGALSGAAMGDGALDASSVASDDVPRVRVKAGRGAHGGGPRPRWLRSG